MSRLTHVALRSRQLLHVVRLAVAHGPVTGSAAARRARAPGSAAPRSLARWAVALLAIVISAVGCDRSRPVDRDPVDLTLPDVLSGTDVQLSDFEGDVILLNFWATWCTPCRMEIPDLMALQRRYRDRGLTVIGIAIDDLEPTRELVRALDVNYVNLLGTDSAARALGGITGFPTTFLLDRSRRPVVRFPGLAPPRLLEQEVLALIGTHDS